ncbi:hypothetical protein [Marinicrinis lubricantis]|uniref:Uncharacterized protein n=1 Tax=Marinicrinis lubricantis TaxID=2086470 RepID=A0ABW1INX8_9BACL
MIGLIVIILILNWWAFRIRHWFTANQIVHVWCFTTGFQSIFDLYVDNKYHGYWYFTKAVDWLGLPAHVVLIPPVNLLFIRFFPFQRKWFFKLGYILLFSILILLYELVAMLPEPWGYFHYGWWTIWHSAALDPILLLILLSYYRWICRLERKACSSI